MTTITLEKPIALKTLHFYDADALMKAILQSEFEANLDQKYQKAKNAKKEDFVNL